MEVKKYVKKPIVIEAIQYTGENTEDVVNFITDRHCTILNDKRILINTLEGNIEASPNDYIIKGVKGEFYPCKPDIFKSTYDLVTD